MRYICRDYDTPKKFSMKSPIPVGKFSAQHAFKSGWGRQIDHKVAARIGGLFKRK